MKYSVDVKVSKVTIDGGKKGRTMENKHSSGSMVDCLNFAAQWATNAAYRIETVAIGRVITTETEASILAKFNSQK